MAEYKDKKLTRSRDNRWLAGVCGGIAEYFEVDSTLIRVLFILFSFAVGGGILIYIILWLIMPEASATNGNGDLLADMPPEQDQTAVDEPQADDEDEQLSTETGES